MIIFRKILFFATIKSNSTICKILRRIRDHNDRLYVFSILVIIICAREAKADIGLAVDYYYYDDYDPGINCTNSVFSILPEYVSRISSQYAPNALRVLNRFKAILEQRREERSPFLLMFMQLFFANLVKKESKIDIT